MANCRVIRACCHVKVGLAVSRATCHSITASCHINMSAGPEEEEAEGGDGGGQETGKNHGIGVERHCLAPPREERLEVPNDGGAGGCQLHVGQLHGVEDGPHGGKLLLGGELVTRVAQDWGGWCSRGPVTW